MAPQYGYSQVPCSTMLCWTEGGGNQPSLGLSVVSGMDPELGARPPALSSSQGSGEHAEGSILLCY